MKLLLWVWKLGKNIGLAIRFGLSWLFKDGQRVIIAALLLAMVFLGLKYLDAKAVAASEAELRVRMTSLYDAEQVAHAVTKQDYARAQIAAAVQDQQRIEAVEASFTRKLETISHENQTLRADLRARALAFVQNDSRTQTASGPPASEQLPALSDMPAGSVQAACPPGLSETDALAIADAYAQLETLIAAWDAARAASLEGQRLIDNQQSEPDDGKAG